jgi:hypothetical protein
VTTIASAIAHYRVACLALAFAYDARFPHGESIRDAERTAYRAAESLLVTLGDAREVFALHAAFCRSREAVIEDCLAAGRRAARARAA